MSRTRRDPIDGPARLLAVVYSIFALSAGARSVVQITESFGDAPLAYSLSAAAALIYLLAAVAFWRKSGRSWPVAVWALVVELAGVLIVGTLTLVDEEWFPDATVWSGFGAGYGYVPLVLPIVGLAWLLRPATRASFAADDAT